MRMKMRKHFVLLVTIMMLSISMIAVSSGAEDGAPTPAGFCTASSNPGHKTAPKACAGDQGGTRTNGIQCKGNPLDC